jgi:YggT family protein
MIAALIDSYSLILVVAVIMSWVSVDRRNPLAAVVHGLTEPVLEPIRRMLPPTGGLDLSPMVLLFALQFLKRFV